MRRLWALLLCALLLCAPAGAETFAVNAGENALLVTDAGEALTAWGEYATAARVFAAGLSAGADAVRRRAGALGAARGRGRRATSPPAAC